MSKLKPCRYCGGTNTIIDENTYWTGMRAEVLSYSITHWCESQEDDFTKSTIRIRARSEKELERFWNG